MKIKARSLNGLLEKTLGLMFSGKIAPIYFETRWGIHTFFVQKPIDVIIMDRNLRVQILRRGLKPYRIFFWNPAFFRVIEAPQGFIAKNKLTIGSKIEIS